MLRRLPAGVEYTFVKMIIAQAPPALTTLSWLAAAPDESPWGWFRARKSYRAIDRALQRQAQNLPANPQSTVHQTFRAVRNQFVQQVLGAIDLAANRTKRWISITLSDPARLVETHRLPGPLRPTWVIGVWRWSRKGAVLLAERRLLPGPPPGGHTRVAWFDPEQFDETCRALFRKYFPDVLRMKPGRPWRTNRRSTVGWPLITQGIVPALYDYLKPYYRARRYRHHRHQVSAGHYPLQLRRDICALVCLELPHLARELTVARVTAAIQRHLAVASQDRPMGRAMFVVGGGNPENRVT